MRTTTPNPLAEKYYSTSPYAWCNNNPVKFIDPDGRDIKIWYYDNNKLQTWIFNGKNKMMPNNELVRNFMKAYNYNITNGGGYALKEAAYSTIFTVNLAEITDKSSNFSHRTIIKNKQKRSEKFVNWNTKLGLETTDNKTISPATLLEHEFGHATRYESNNDISNYRKDSKIGSDKQYETKEERRVITGIEAKTAQSNSEVPKDYIRPNHKGKSIFTKSVISNKKIKYYEPN